MAKRGTTQPPSRGQPTVSPSQGIDLLTRQIESGRGLVSKRPLADDVLERWQMVTRSYIEKAFGEHSPQLSDFRSAGSIGLIVSGRPDAWWEAKRVESLGQQLTCLSGLVELLQTEVSLAAPQQAAQPRMGQVGHRIFLVHGHDEGTLHEVARFLEQLEQDVLVLRELPSEGRTIIEKFEEYSDVGFAVVLLTPDDRGGATSSSDHRPRARQNVILELGYFLGKLGRRRVCALHKGNVEIPSDYSGVLYVAMDDAGAWRLHLARELKAAGLRIDMNKAV